MGEGRGVRAGKLEKRGAMFFHPFIKRKKSNF